LKKETPDELRLGAKAPNRTSNIERPTSNIEVTKPAGSCIEVGRAAARGEGAKANIEHPTSNVQRPSCRAARIMVGRAAKGTKANVQHRHGLFPKDSSAFLRAAAL
jgi:hypothetical protein